MGRILRLRSSKHMKGETTREAIYGKWASGYLLTVYCWGPLLDSWGLAISSSAG
jgi:hypothetical protein